MLTHKQRKVLQYLISEQQAGRSPTVREVMHGTGGANHSATYGVLMRLEDRGFIRAAPGQHRAIVILKRPETV